MSKPFWWAFSLGEKKPALESEPPNQANVVMNDPGVFVLDFFDDNYSHLISKPPKKQGYESSWPFSFVPPERHSLCVLS